MEIAARNARQIGEAIRRYRRRRGFTQEELARRSDHNQTTISDLERGRPGDRETLYGVLAALGLEIVLRDRSPVGPGARDIGAVF